MQNNYNYHSYMHYHSYIMHVKAFHELQKTIQMILVPKSLHWWVPLVISFVFYGLFSVFLHLCNHVVKSLISPSASYLHLRETSVLFLTPFFLTSPLSLSISQTYLLKCLSITSNLLCLKQNV